MNTLEQKSYTSWLFLFVSIVIALFITMQNNKDEEKLYPPPNSVEEKAKTKHGTCPNDSIYFENKIENKPNYDADD